MPDLSVLCYDLRSSGVVRNALRIAGAAHDAGIETEIWVARSTGALRDEVPQGVRLIDAGRGQWMPGRTLDLAMSIASLARYLAQQRPRIALSSGNHMHVAARMACRIAGMPKGVALWARASNATLAVPLQAYLGRPLPRLAARATNLVNRWQYASMEQVIAVCRELADHLVDDLHLPRQRVSVIANGVDCGAVARLGQAALDDSWCDGRVPLIVSAGRLSKQKNFGDLIRAVAVVQRQMNVRLVILGEGPASEQQALVALARQLGIADHVRLAGYDANPYRWMARASVFVISSRWEGASNVVLEALAVGTPVVAYRCPTGIAEVISPLGAELMVEPGDVAGLAAAIVRRLATPRDSAMLKAHAERYDLDAMLGFYVAKFSAALNGQR